MKTFFIIMLIMLGTIGLILSAIRWENSPYNSGEEFIFKALCNIICGIFYLLAGILTQI